MKKTNKNTLLFLASALAGITAFAGVGTLLDVKDASANSTPVFEMIDGAGLRTSDPTGLRFKAKMDAYYYNEITTTNKDLYIAVIPYSYYTAYQAANTDMALYPWLAGTYGASNLLNLQIPDSKIYQATIDGTSYYCANGVISNIRLNNYHLDFVGAAYITDGTTYTDVSNLIEEDNARSVFEVAVKAYEDDEDRALYNDFLEETIEKGMYNAYGVKHNTTTGKYVYNDVQYDSLEAAAEAIVDVDASYIELANATLSIGKTKQLSAKFYFADGKEFTQDMYYTWSSSNTGVATVDENGVVTAKAIGTTEITVSSINGKYTATATLTVTEKATVTVAEGIAFTAKGNGGEWSFNTGDAEITLDGLEFSFKDVQAVTVNGSAVAFNAISATTIKLTNAPAGDQLYTFETSDAKYVIGGCIYNMGISTVDDLKYWRNGEYFGYAVLLNNIDFEGETLDRAAVNNVSGTLDGRGYTISNFTYKDGFVNGLYSSSDRARPSSIKNLQILNATQDCGGVKYPGNGFFGASINGVVENVYLEVNLTNYDLDHCGAWAYQIGDNGVLKNTVLNIKSNVQLSGNGGVYGLNSNNALDGNWENNYIVKSGWAVHYGKKNNVDVYYSDSNKQSSVSDLFNHASPSLASLGGYWNNNASTTTISMKPWPEVALKTVEVEGEFLAQGDAGKAATNIGNASIDFTSAGINGAEVKGVMVDGKAIDYSVDGNAITFVNPTAGAHKATITAGAVNYVVDVFFYGMGISTLEQLEDWRTHDYKTYAVLLNHVDCGGATLAEVDYYMPGILDGRGYAVMNFSTTKGFVGNIGGSGVIKNLQLLNVTQDCSKADKDGNLTVDYGVLGQDNMGTVENILIDAKFINEPNVDHYGLIYKGAHANSVMRNVIMYLTGDGSANHYVGPMWRDGSNTWTVENLMVVTGSRTYIREDEAGDVHAYSSKAALATAVNVSTWGGYWTVDASGVPMMREIEKTTQVIAGEFLAQGDNGKNVSTIGNAAIDVSSAGINASNVIGVLVDGAAINYSVSGNSVVLNNPAAGDHEVTIMTSMVDYKLDACFYGIGISTLAELEDWRKNSAEYAAYTILLNHIDCGGATLFDTDNYANCVFDGRGYAVMNFTMSRGFVGSIGGNGGVRNLQILNATQDCSFADGGAVMWGAIGRDNFGFVENVLIDVKMINVPAGKDHYGLVYMGAHNGSRMSNVVIYANSDGSGNHFVGPMYRDGNWIVENLMIVTNARMYWDAYTEANARVFGSKEAFATTVNVSTWGGYWTVDEDGMPAMNKISKETYTIDGEFLAQGDAGQKSREIGNAAVNLTAVGISAASVTGVMVDGEASQFAVSGDSVVIKNPAAGEHNVTIMTATADYETKVFFYGIGISTLAELEDWRKNSAEYAAYTILLNHIDCGGATLTNITSYANCVLDGRGYAVMNFTMSQGFVGSIGGNGGIRNLQILNATQDCSFANGGAVMWGAIGRDNFGFVENVLIDVKMINVPAGKDHYGLVYMGANNGSRMSNVVIYANSDGSGNHFVGPMYCDGNWIVENLMIVTNAPMYWHVYTEANARVFGSKAELATTVNVSTWGGYWTVGEDGMPTMREIAKTTQVLQGTFLAKGDAGQWGGVNGSSPTGKATFDLSSAGVNINNVTSVLCNGTEVQFSVKGNGLQVTNAPGGDQVYTVKTPYENYIFNGCVYAVGISTLSELEYWRTNEHYSYAVLLNDIDCGGATLAEPRTYLCGMFDGRGYTISNFTINGGFINHTFADVGTNAGVKNLKVIDVVQDCSFAVDGDGNPTGVALGIFGGRVHGHFENLYVEMATKNVKVEHYGALFNVAQAGSIVKNVVVNVTESDTDKFHYFMMSNFSGTFENVYGVYADGNSAMYQRENGELARDNCFESISSMLLGKPSISSWGSYWNNSPTAVNLLPLDAVTSGNEDVEDGYIVKDSKTEYVILVNDSDMQMNFAAIQELYALFKEATGAQLKIVNDANLTDGMKYISIGNTDALSFNGIQTNANLGAQGYILKELNECIYIWSEGGDGATYGVYDLMNQWFNFEQYSELVYTLDKASTKAYTSIEEKEESPAIEYRSAPTGAILSNKTALNRMRMGIYGEGFVSGGMMHNMLTSVVPYTEYISTNSDWFSGSKGEEKSQLCYTAHGNVDSYNAMVQVAVENIIELLKEDTQNSIFSLTQMDNTNVCNCSSCSGKNIVDLQTKFVNDVTSRVQVWLDDPEGGNGRKVQFATAAYQYTAEVMPTLALNENVAIWLAPIDDNWAQTPYASGNVLGSLVDAWTEKAPGGIMLWSYNAYFHNYMLSFDNYDVLDDLLQFTAENNVKYFWAQGAYNMDASTAFESVKTYVVSKLMWNPYLDVDTLIDNYFEGVYGTGAVATNMRAAFNAMRQENTKKTQGDISNMPEPGTGFWGAYDSTIWSKDYLNSQMELFKAAVDALGVKEGPVYDAIVCETISVRWMLKNYRGTTSSYDGNAWGSFTQDTERLGFNRFDEFED